MEIDNYEVAVVGGGHAGVEAAAASARRGAKTLLLTDNYSTIGQMSCNPAVGGLSKGQLVREVDALGGLIGRATEQAGIQFRTLNKSKGAAVQSPRAQCDRGLYQRKIQGLLEQHTRLTIREDRVVKLKTDSSNVTGVKTVSGTEYNADSVVLATGTFLNGRIFIGLQNYPGGRRGDPAATGLAEQLKDLGFQTDRLKTGTPPRLDGTSINLADLRRQEGESPPPRFSYYHDFEVENKRPCWLTSTNEQTHEIIQSGLDRSPLHGTGDIEGTGVRYCPSIEDKVLRFEDRDSHIVFLEPEGLETTEIYANGLPTSLPVDVQLEFIHSIDGLEEAEVTRWGYAIEYDFYQPTQLHNTLETQKLSNLFFAGQINGTTGYEEAAAQGLVAGVNAAAKPLDAEPLVLDRTEAYVGVLIDDLVTEGTQEPYRMFTSRAEHRLRLRCDNAHYRLLPRAQELNLVTPETWSDFSREKKTRDRLLDQLKNTRVKPKSTEEQNLNAGLEEDLGLNESTTLWQLLKRPEVGTANLVESGIIDDPDPGRVLEHLGIEAKYEGYIKRQQNQVEKTRRLESKQIPRDFDYTALSGLSNESIEKLERICPNTVGQAGRISGIKPTDVQIILTHLEEPNS